MLKNKSAKKKVNKELLRRPDVYVTALSSKNELKAARSATTGEVFDTLDERIDCEVDRLNKKIDVTMLQQEDKESHTIENTVEGMTTDMVIKGRTLQNACPKFTSNNGFGNIVVSENILEATGSDTSHTQFYFNKDNIGLFKPNTTYTIITKIIENTLTGKLQVVNGSQPFISKNAIEVPEGYVGDFVDIFTTKEDFAITSHYFGLIVPRGVLGKVKLSSYLILEGDWRNKQIPHYFEGIKSFGESEGNKISILSSGKNLLNFKSFENYINNTHENEILYPIKLKPNTNYTFSDKTGEWNGKGAFLILKDKDKKEVSRLIDSNVGNRKSISFTTNNNTNYYLFTYKNNIDKFNSISSNYQIEEGLQATFYEPYQSYKKDILLSQYGFDEGLRGFDTNSCDVLNDVSKKAIKRIEKDIITGNEDFQKAGNANYYFLIGNNHKPLSKTLNNKYPDKNCSNVEENGLWCGNAYKLCIKDLSVNTVEELKTKLKQWYVEENPLIIYYELAEPVETPLDENINVKSFNEKTYISFENALSGTSSFKAPVNTVATIARLNRENRALEEENRSLRQDFESTTLSLTDSDLELVKQNVDMDFRLMEVEFALDIPQSTLSSDIKFKNKKGEVKSMARTPYEMMKIVILSGDYDREDYMHKVGKYYERGRMTKEEHDELMSLMTADEVISK